jgi:outer membrane protein assembly factor BamB
MFRGDPRHTGAYGAPTGVHLAGLQWRFETDGAVVSSPAIVGDTVWIGSADGSVYALDLESGAVRWATKLGSPISASPAVGGGRVVVVTRDGRIVALTSARGRQLWSIATGPDHPWPWGHESGDQWTGSATLAGGIAYVGSGEGHVLAIDVARGTVRWRAPTEGRVRSTPAVTGGSVIVGSADGRVYAFDAATGRQRWRFETEGAGLHSEKFGFDRRTIQSSPAIADSVVLIGARDGMLYALHQATGRELWRSDHRVSWVNGSAAIREGTAYVGSSDAAFLQAVDRNTGTERWRKPTGAVVWGSAAATDRLVIYGDGAGRVRALDRATGTERWTFFTEAQVYSSPVPAGRLVVFGSMDGGVYALRTTDDGPIRRAVYLDTAGPAKPPAAELAVARTLGSRGYQVLGRDSLAAFLTERIADPAPSVVVFATDELPADVIRPPLDRSLLRRYLDRGGKVVWGSVPPLVYPRDSSGQRGGLATLVWTRADTLLGMKHAGTIFDRRSVRPTAAGRRWGLTGRWRDGWGIEPAAASEVLGLDDWGLAAAWVRTYGGSAGTGFVRISFDDPKQVYWTAEYRPGRAR